jgi:hypothetical protein
MASRQVIITTVFGPKAESIAKTFASFLKVPDAELHVFVYNQELPHDRHPKLQYHLVQHDPAFTSIRRDALFRRWTLPDQLDAEYALVVDGTDAICIHPLPAFQQILRGACLAAATEWVPPIRILGQGFTSTYLNAGVTFWHLPGSSKIRHEVAARGRAHYRGPFDDQTVLNEVVQTSYFDQLAILPSQFNWRALYRKNFRSWHHHFRNWPRVDSLDGVFIYHNQHCVDEVLSALESQQPAARAKLPNLPADTQPLSPSTLFWRRLVHRWLHS